MKKYIVLGSSAAGVNGARELRRLDPDAEITMISPDHRPYSRCILHQYLGGERDLDGISFVERDFANLYRLDYRGGRACAGVDTAAKTVRLDNGDALPYDKLLVATGAGSFMPPVPGLREADNVVGFRNLGDIEFLKNHAASSRHVVIMGGGLVGVDALSGFLHLGHKPVLVEMADRLLSKQLDARAASTYESRFAAKGVRFHFDVGAKEVRADAAGKVRQVILSDGTALPCDLLIVTAGVRSNVGFLEGSGVETGKFGLVIDPRGRTNVPDVFGAGDVTGMSPIWPVAVKEGIVAARNMAGARGEMTDFFASKSTMNFEGVPSMSLGVNEAPDETYEVEILERGDTYKKIIHKDGKIHGAVLQGDLSYGGILTQLIAHRVDVSRVKKSLFAVDYSDFFHMKDNFEFYYDEDGASGK